MTRYNRDGSGAEELLTEGFPDPDTDLLAEAAAEEESLDSFCENIRDFVDDESSDFIGSLVSMVADLVDTDWPDSAVRQVAEEYSLKTEEKLKLLRRFRDSVYYSGWAEENGGASSGLDELEEKWEAKEARGNKIRKQSRKRK
jgi:hypothetical protein